MVIFRREWKKSEHLLPLGPYRFTVMFGLMLSALIRPYLNKDAAMNHVGREKGFLFFFLPQGFSYALKFPGFSSLTLEHS